MTVTNTTTKSIQTGTGALTAFDFAFKIFQASDLEVYVDGVLQTLTTHYSVSFDTDDETGTVTFVTAPANGTQVLIKAVLPITQGTAFPVEGAYSKESVENAFDKATILDLQLNEKLARSLQLPITTTLGSLELGGTPTAYHLLRWNSTTDGIEPVNPEEITVPVTGTGFIAGPATTSQYRTPYWDAANKTLANGAAPGVAGQILASNGTTSAPSYQVLPVQKNLFFGQMPYYTSASTYTLPSGFRCWSDDYAMELVIASDQAVVLSASGANGLDTGAEANNTKYHLWVIGDSTGANATKGLWSTSATSPTLPSGYNKKRLVPTCTRNDGSGNLLRTKLRNYGPSIETQWIVQLPPVTATVGPTNVKDGHGTGGFTTVSLASFVLATAGCRDVKLRLGGVYASASTTFSLAPGDAASTTYADQRLVTSAMTFFDDAIWMEMDTSHQIQLGLSGTGGTCDLAVAGFLVHI